MEGAKIVIGESYYIYCIQETISKRCVEFVSWKKKKVTD